MQAAEVQEKIEEKFQERVLEKKEFRGERTIVVKRESLKEILQYCRDALKFDMLLDVSSVDHFGDEPRFEMVYELYSLETKTHLRVKCTVSEDDCKVDSVADIWPTADWHEREVYDMMGIRFEGHPDLRRILMWEGYPYYPLRKDFPLEGKSSDAGLTAFTKPAPLEGGPFVTVPSSEERHKREPRAHPPEI